MNSDWVVRNFADVVFLQEGPGIRKYEYAEDGYPMINVRCVQNGYIDMSSSRNAKMELATNKWKHFQVDAGDILFTISGTIGRSAIVQEEDLPLLMNTSVVRFKPIDENLDRRFLYHIVRSQSFVDSLIDQSTGTAIKNVGPSHLKKMKISYPSLPEQKLIVAKLDKCFDSIDKARANVERNLQNAKDLFQSKLNEIFSQKGDGWVEKRLGDCCTLQRGFDLPKRLRTKGDYPLVSSSGISDTHNEFKVTAPGVTTGRSGSIGKVFFIKDNFWPLNTVLYIKNFHDNYEKLIYYLLQHFDLEKYSSGSGVPTLNRNFVHSEIVTIPENYSDQKNIVTQLDELKSKSQLIQSNYLRELVALDELKKSILQKAFEGELT